MRALLINNAHKELQLSEWMIKSIKEAASHKESFYTKLSERTYYIGGDHQKLATTDEVAAIKLLIEHGLVNEDISGSRCDGMATDKLITMIKDNENY